MKDQPGLEIDSCAPGAYVLIQGKVLAKPAAGDRQQLLVKAQKVGAIRALVDASHQASVSFPMLQREVAARCKPRPMQGGPYLRPGSS